LIAQDEKTQLHELGKENENVQIAQPHKASQSQASIQVFNDHGIADRPAGREPNGSALRSHDPNRWKLLQFFASFLLSSTSARKGNPKKAEVKPIVAMPEIATF
jgi:hypothetical protein